MWNFFLIFMIMEISIPVLYHGKEGTVCISTLSDGKRKITVTVDGYSMDLIQNGEVKNTPSQGLIQGTLYKVMEERLVGNKKWKVKDFILEVASSRGIQKRILQASGEVIDEIERVKVGHPLLCEINFLGKEFNRGFDQVYRNLDEVSKIHLI